MKSTACLTGCLSALAFAVAISSTSVQADVTLDFEQQGSDVVASYSGAWTSWTTTNQLNLNDNRIFALGFQSFGAAEERFWSGAGTTKATGADWTTLDIDADSFTGDAFGFSTSSGGFLYAPADYTAGTPFSGSMTFNDKTVVDLGLTPGDIGSFTSSGGTINYTVSAVPEPATVGMLAAGCVAAGLGFVRWRRKGSQSVVSRG
jgi:PEP-CTERM putative exosortase interaction domain